MGKKQGDSQRTKGNAVPSSSSRAAEMLQQVESNFGNLTSGMPSLWDDSLDLGIDAEMRMVLKKLSKKDNLTKLKSLEELKILLDSRSNEDCNAIVPTWSKIYTKLTIENDRKIRESTQQVHDKLCSKVKRNLAPYLKTIMPYWLLAQSDLYSIAALVAERSFKSTFNETKQPEVIHFASDEILNVIYDFLLVETAKTLSDMKVTCQDEADQKYENVICMSLRAFGIFLKYFMHPISSKTQPAKLSVEKLEKIFNNPSFWKLSKDQSNKVRVEMYTLLSWILNSIVLNKAAQQLSNDESTLIGPLIDNLKKKIIPLIFYSCEEENHQCASLIWSGIRQCMISLDPYDVLVLVNIKKSFLPKFLALLKPTSTRYNTDNTQIIFSLLIDIVPRVGKCLDFESQDDDQLTFYNEVLKKLCDGILKTASGQSKQKMNQEASVQSGISAFFDSFCVIYIQIAEKTTSLAFFSDIIINDVIKVIEWQLNCNNSESNAAFEFGFAKFLITIDKSPQVKELTWSKIETVLRKALSNESTDLVVRNFSRTFNHASQFPELKEKTQHLVNLVFSEVLANLNQQHKPRLNSLKSLNFLSKNFIRRENFTVILNLFLNSTQHETKIIDKSNGFNEIFIESLLKQHAQDSQVVFEVIILFLSVNKLLGNHESAQNLLLDKLDIYLFDSNLASQPEYFIHEYLQWLKSDEFDTEIHKFVSEWINKSSRLKDLASDKITKSPTNRFFSKDILDLVEFINQNKLDTLQKLIIYKNQSFLKYVLSETFEVNLEDLESFLEFNIKFIRTISFGFNSTYIWWKLLSLLKLQKTTKCFTWVKVNSLVSELLQTIVDIIVNEKHDTDGLSEPIASDCLADRIDVDDLVSDLIKLIEKSLTDQKQKVVQEILLDLINKTGSKSFQSVFERVIFEQPEDKIIHRNLLIKLFLNERLNYLYTDQQSSLIRSLSLAEQKNKAELKQSSYLNQLNYALSLIYVYINYSYPDDSKELLFGPKSFLFVNSNWFYLLSSALLVDQFYPLKEEKSNSSSLIIDSIKNKLKSLFYSNGGFFMKNLFQALIDSGDSEFVDFDILKLNHISFFFTRCVDMAMTRFTDCESLLDVLNRFSLHLISHLICLRSLNSSDEIIKFYLYDLSFAKHSVLSNLDGLRQNIDHYFAVFGDLIQLKTNQLESIVSQLILSKDSNQLSQFNSLLDLLTKYIGFFISMLQSIELDFLGKKVYEVFNSSGQTVDFIAKNLSKNILRIIEFVAKLKTATKNIDSLFFLNLKNINWNSLVMIDRLNSFLSLFFRVYRLGCNAYEQISKYFDDKHWDFVLCYLTELAQCLDPSRNAHLYLVFCSYSNLLNRLTQTVNQVVTQTAANNKNVYSEWSGFFEKEIFDKLLLNYVNLVEQKKSDDDLVVLQNLVIESLGNAVAQISFERLHANQLEVRLNVLDIDLEGISLSPTGTKKIPVISLNDKLVSVINIFVPMLRDELACVQWNAYRILRTVMNEVNRFYQDQPMNDSINEVEDEEEKTSQLMSIVESLPYAFRNSLAELTELFGDLKTLVQFDESILIPNDEDQEDPASSEKLRNKTNNKLMSFLLINKLVINMLSRTCSFEFKIKLGSDLRRTKFIDNLMNVLFRIMPGSAGILTNRNLVRQDFFKADEMFDLKVLSPISDIYPNCFGNDQVEWFACRLYKHALQLVPAIIRDWWNIQIKRIADQVEKFTIKFVSPILIEEEIRQVNKLSQLTSFQPVSNTGITKSKFIQEDDEQSVLKIRGMLSTREIVSTYKMKELSMELTIELPLNYPLGVVKVACGKRIGVSENEWRNWMLQLTNYLTHQNGSMYQGLQIWKNNVDKKFAGVEECTVCYSVIHGTNFQLPKMKCRTCKKKFHSVCLYKWFESSNKSTCPLCRNIF